MSDEIFPHTRPTFDVSDFPAMGVRPPGMARGSRSKLDKVTQTLQRAKPGIRAKLIVQDLHLRGVDRGLGTYVKAAIGELRTRARR